MFLKQFYFLDTGPLIHEIIEYFETKLTDPVSGPKLVAYCCHDGNIAGILKVLGTYERHLPVHACSIFFELRQKNGTPYLNVIYNQAEDVPVSVLGHDFDIKLTDFKNALSNYSMTKKEFYNKCELKI